MRSSVSSFLAGLVFAIGLAVSGMTAPRRVLAFLDVGGQWDPSLALVMLSAIVVFATSYRLSRRMRKPAFAASFQASTNTRITARLSLGAVIFGAGWGLAGYCPGPALVALGARGTQPAVFCGAMAFGFWAIRRLDERVERRASVASALG